MDRLIIVTSEIAWILSSDIHHHHQYVSNRLPSPHCLRVRKQPASQARTDSGKRGDGEREGFLWYGGGGGGEKEKAVAHHYILMRTHTPLATNSVFFEDEFIAEYVCVSSKAPNCCAVMGYQMQERFPLSADQRIYFLIVGRWISTLLHRQSLF